MLFTCLKIFSARIVDVSLGTIRTIFFVKGKLIEPFIIAFFEVFIWYFIARQALNAEGNTLLIAISYAGGYATGTLLGAKLSKILVKDVFGVQAVIKNGSKDLVATLHSKGYGVSVMELKDAFSNEDKEMLYIQVNSKMLKDLTETIKDYDKNAFIAVNETKFIQNGILK